MRKFYSRLVKKEEVKNLRRSVFFIILTGMLILLIFFYGIPALTKLAVFLSETQNPDSSTRQEDLVPLLPPKFFSVVEATNSGLLSLSGYTQEGSNVEIVLNGLVSKTVKTNNGIFTLDGLKLAEGENEISAVAINEKGKRSHPSETVRILFDNIPPSLTIKEPQNDSRFAQKNIKVSGATDPEFTLTINDHLVILGKDGNFSLTYTLTEGENNLKIVVTDKAGNKTEKEIKVTYNSDQ